MALTDKATTNTPAFEMDEAEVGVDTGTAGADTTAEQTTTAKGSANERVAAAAAKQAAKADAEKAAAAPAAAPAAASTQTAVAVASKPNELVVAMTKANPFTALVNAIHVDYNTLHRIMVSNGNVMSKELQGKEGQMGETCALELISTQKHWVMAPGGDKDDEESLQYLKYSDDGKSERETGKPLTEFLDAAIKAGYDKARITERLILVGELIDAGKLNSTMKGELVQLDLAPRSVKNFNTFTVNAAFRVAKGRMSADDAVKVRIRCSVQTKGSNNWTDAEFEPYVSATPAA